MVPKNIYVCVKTDFELNNSIVMSEAGFHPIFLAYTNGMEIEWKPYCATCYHIGPVNIRDHLFPWQTMWPLHDEV